MNCILCGGEPVWFIGRLDGSNSFQWSGEYCDHCFVLKVSPLLTIIRKRLKELEHE